MAMVISQGKIHRLLKSNCARGCCGDTDFARRTTTMAVGQLNRKKKQEKQRDGLVVTALVMGVEASAAAIAKA
jgi:hypothetical protein